MSYLLVVSKVTDLQLMPRNSVSYFQTTIPGAGIFLPKGRATRRDSPSIQDDAFPITPTTPSAMLSNFRPGASLSFTPPTPSVPKFSQSVGPGRAPSPQFKKSRPSLPRPESPLRKPQIAGRPSMGTPVSRVPPRYGSPAPSKFGQSVRGTQDSRDPSKKPAITPRAGFKASVGPRSTSALGNAPLNISDDDTTPVGNRMVNNSNLNSVSSFNNKIRPASRANNDEVDKLRMQLEEKDRQLQEQASSLAEMESSLVEVQTLMSEDGVGRNRNSMEDKDAAQLRSVLREKNEKIAMLTAEFDAHRADFRSTIDTLELASTETERVYEKRVEELLQEVRDFQERSEDVESVAQQLKQLEELVQELEEGLEDARRGEAEARGEVEFLRGEVERTRSELRREREKSQEALKNATSASDNTALAKDLAQRDDEIRGLKAIIHSLSRDSISDSSGSSPDLQKTPRQRPGSLQTDQRLSHANDRIAREKLEKELAELRADFDSKVKHEDELEREVELLRRGNANGAQSQRASAITIASTGTVTQDQNSSLRDSKGTVMNWQQPRLPETHRRGNTLDTMPESDTYSSTAESFCELCETSGHDILTCTNMFTSNGSSKENAMQRTGKDVVTQALGLSPKPTSDGFIPAPLSPRKSTNATPVKILPNPMESGPVAGKESGVVNMDKWCGVCEREGHDSIDCPFEDAF